MMRREEDCDMEQTAAATQKPGGLPPVPGWNKFLYSFGYIGTSVVDRVMATWVLFYYAPPKGSGEVTLVPAAIVGLIFLIGRGLDTIIDPGVAFYTDGCRSRRGRRMPFMLYGGLPLAASMALMFFPPVRHTSAVNTVYLAVLLSTFFFFFSFYVCPYLALLPEIARSPEERINLTSTQGIFMLLGTVIGMVASPMLIQKFGYKGMAVVMGGIAAISFYAPVAGINEKKYCAAEPSHLNITQSIVSTLKNKPFVIYLVGNLTFWFGFNIISTCVPYYVTALLKLDKGYVTIFFALALGMAFVCIPLMNFLTRKIGKRNTMICSLGMFLVLMPAIYFFGKPGSGELMKSLGIPLFGIEPKLMFAYIIIALVGIPLASLFIVPNALVADLTDLDEKFTGLRREAIYFGTQGLFLKIDLGVSSVLMTQMFALYGYSVAHPLGIRLTGFVGAFFALTGIIAFLMYPKDLKVYAAQHPEMYKH
jgi:glycoside/pentoside/hexuronide:cation symporter, GPH family